MTVGVAVGRAKGRRLNVVKPMAGERACGARSMLETVVGFRLCIT